MCVHALCLWHNPTRHKAQCRHPISDLCLVAFWLSCLESVVHTLKPHLETPTIFRLFLNAALPVIPPTHSTVGFFSAPLKTNGCYDSSAYKLFSNKSSDVICYSHFTEKKDFLHKNINDDVWKWNKKRFQLYLFVLFKLFNTLMIDVSCHFLYLKEVTVHTSAHGIYGKTLCGHVFNTSTLLHPFILHLKDDSCNSNHNDTMKQLCVCVSAVIC